jgi:hypothetical protein
VPPRSSPKRPPGDPLYTLAYYQAGLSYVNLRRYASAIKAFQQTIGATRAEQHLAHLEKQRTSLASGYRPPAEVLLSLGSAHFRSGDRDAAETGMKGGRGGQSQARRGPQQSRGRLRADRRCAEAEAELNAAEKAGFRVNPQLKEDIKKRLTRR